jgi:hypothetical protein
MAMAIGLLVASVGAASAAPAYRFYSVCSHNKNAPEDSTCPKNGKKGAVFKSNNASVVFKICVKFPGGQKLCANNQPAPKGVKVLNTITSNQKGDHRITWKVNGVLVGSYTMTVT